jgi:hypothetical protein
MSEAAKKDDEEKLIPVGPGAEGLEAPEAEKAEDEEKPDARLAHDDESDEEKQEPGKKRESSRERRDRAKVARQRERVEYNFLLKRNEDLEKRFAQLEGRAAKTENAAVDQRINNIDAQLANADRVLADALKKPNGGGAEEFTEALRIRDQLRDQRAQLSVSKQQRDSETNSAPQIRKEEPRPDPRVIRNAREWAGKHDWFDFSGNDEDSVIVRAIDETLAGDGFDPTTQEYWDELTQRVRRRLPEKFTKGARARADEDDGDMDDEDERPKQKAGPKFSSGGRERPLKKGEVYVSAERKQAMKDYGVWEDPVARNRMLKKYSQWDAELSASNRS